MRTWHRLLAGSVLLVGLNAAEAVHAQRASYEELQTFSAVLNLIRQHHVDSVTYTPLVRAAIEGALESLDPHSRYARREAEDVLLAARAGEYGGAGVELDDLFGSVTVLSVGRGGAAERAGVLAGDRIVSVQDTTTVGLRAHAVELRLTGAPGSIRRLVVERGGAEHPQRLELQVALTRFVWPAVSAALLLEPEVGYVRLDRFTDGAARDLQRSIEQLRDKRARALVLDLRGNPGGLLSEAVRIAELFLPDRTVVFRTRGRAPEASAEYRTTRSGAFRELPLVLLVDGSSASAAEALAGALQDHRRATIVGHRTFGKALVQTPFPLPAGDVLWLTTARVLTPLGRMIQRPYTGITVDQYRAEAEALRSGDTTAVRSGGITPDVSLEPRPVPPRWWAEVRYSGLDLVAATRATPLSDEPAEWGAPLLAALRAITAEHGIATEDPTPQHVPLMLRHLTALALSIRTGVDAADEYRARNDPEIAGAVAVLARR